jgi:hypothetical protein
MVSVRYKNTLSKYLGTSRRRLLFAALALLVIAGVLYVFFVVTASGSTKNEKCVSGSRRSETASQSITSQEKLKDAYKAAKTYEDDCSQNKVLGVNRDDTETKLSQIQYYHDKSTSAYMLGHKEEAKKDAEKGLAIDAQLTERDRKLKDHAQLIKDLNSVKNGRY